MMRRLRELLPGLVLAAAVFLEGCAPGPDGSSGPVVLEMKGKRVRLGEVRMLFERASGPGSFATAPRESREEFLQTIADKEAIIAIARERSGRLTPAEERILHGADETKLLGALEAELVRKVRSDTAETNRMIARFRRQILAYWILAESDSIARRARAEVVAGTPFPEAAVRYSIADTAFVKGGLLPWATAEQFGRDFSEELFVEDREPGYLSEVRNTPRGFEFFQVQAYRDYDLNENKQLANLIPTLVDAIRTHRRLATWSDSLSKARGLDVDDSALAVLHQGMSAYWDSLMSLFQQTNQRPSEFRPPIARFTEEERRSPLYRFDGEEKTLGEFVADLGAVDPKTWPSAQEREGFREQVSAIALMRLELRVAREMGLDRTPSYLLDVRMEREKVLLGKLQEAVTKEIPEPTPEEVKAYYDSNMDSYRTKNQMILAYVVFPTKSEAQSFHDDAVRNPGKWWSNTCARFLAQRPDLHVVLKSETIDAKNPPSEIREIVAAAFPRKVTDVLDPIRIEKGWAVARIGYNEHEGFHPLEAAAPGIRKKMTDERIDGAMQKLVEEGRRIFRVRSFPERLQAKT